MTLKEFNQSFNEVEFKALFNNPNTFSTHQIALYYQLPDNGKSNQFIKQKCKELGLDIQELTKHKFNSTHKVIHCKHCGKERIITNSEPIEFCSQVCANKYKQLTMSKEQRQSINKKISNSVKKEHKHICPKCGKEFMHIGVAANTWCDTCKKPRLVNKEHILKLNKTKKDDRTRYKKMMAPLHKTVCKGCGVELYVKTNDDVYCFQCSKELKKHQYLLYTEDGKKLFSDETRKKISCKNKQLMLEGKIKPWQSRNIISYAERFFRKVLTLNHIEYKTEVPVKGYFLDFLIEVNGKKIDLEIDGKQHWTEKDRIEHDKIRDKELIELGYNVYRIPWNSLNTLKGKEEMRLKISKFLEYYLLG